MTLMESVRPSSDPRFGDAWPLGPEPGIGLETAVMVLVGNVPRVPSGKERVAMSTGATAVVGRGLVKATWRLPSEGFRRGGSGGGGGSGEGSSCPGVVSGAMLLVVSSSSRRRRALSCCRLGAYCKPALSCVMWLRPTDTLVPFGMGLSDFDLVSDWKLVSDSVGVDRVDVDRRDGLVVEGNSRSGQEEVARFR